MPVFMDDISAEGDAEEIRKGRGSRTNTGKSAQEHNAGSTVLATDKYKYLGTVINTEGNLKDHMQET